MPAKNLLRVSEKGIYLHVYNKGVEQRIIFNDESDYEAFCGFLKDYLNAPGDKESKKEVFNVKGRSFRGTPHQPKNFFNKVELVAYSLFPDHFHMILHQKEAGSVQNFLRSISTRYSIYFNKKYKRTGSLFEGPYKSVQISELHLLVKLTQYIHQGSNFSSRPQFTLQKDLPSWIKTSIVHDQIGGNYRNFGKDNKLTEAEMNSIKLIKIESETHSLVRRDLAATPQSQIIPSLPIKIKKQYRFPEYFGIAATFVVLFSLGIKNINELQQKHITQTPEVHAENVVDALQDEPITLIDKKAPSEVLSADTVSKSLIEPANLLYSVVVVNKGSGKLNIYKEISEKSAVVTTADEGDALVAIPVNQDWYEIRFSDDTVGYVLSKFVSLQKFNK